MKTKKYASISTLRAFLDNLKNLFTTKETFEAHTDNAKMHVSVADRYAWDSANGHMNDDSVHVTTADKDYWDSILSNANDYADDAAAAAAASVKNDILTQLNGKAVVQIVTWGADD